MSDSDMILQVYSEVKELRELIIKTYEQTLKTNGRVTKNETNLDNIKDCIDEIKVSDKLQEKFIVKEKLRWSIIGSVATISLGVIIEVLRFII